MVFRCHLLRLVLHCRQQQSAGVITAQSAQTPAECHCQGPVIRYGTPNGYLGCMAAVNYSSLSSHLIPLGLYLFPLLCSFFVISPAVLSQLFFFFLFALPLPDWLSSPSRIVRSSSGFIDHQREKEVEGEAFRWKAIVFLSLPGASAMQLICSNLPVSSEEQGM